MRIAVRLLLSLTGVAALLLAGTSSSPLRAAAAPPPEQQLRTYAAQVSEVFDRHNAIRADHGLGPLRYSPALATRFTQPWNDHLADADASLRHQDLQPLASWPGATGAGENLYSGSGRYGTPQAAMDGWMASPGHRENILKPNWDYIAIGWSVSPSGRAYSTVNFWSGHLTGLGSTYADGAALRTALTGGTSATVNVYTTQGYHTVNGRRWHTTCEAYSSVVRRCRAEIWATKVTYANGIYTQHNGWAFNNLTYLPAPRSYWGSNPLANTGTWYQSGRRWETSCGDAWTGPAGCRSFVHATIVESYLDAAGNRRFRSVPNTRVFNNIVQFS
ncbi:CAP domain-containing protein [Tessaracoccus sp. OS52]|uniref:CAP domain-containing protein n=1 Tax=Tessaracoccus sp. OS52 TaxID=2886691 RepID=UPI001D12FB8E|nr:CAP domain-containing protein [Tessaracoccus sp. OS52]MCC2593097.1 CAP domain-containing protein [Tessaracoccus sp. OS52]